MTKHKEELPKLPKVFKRKWIEALRSGKYKQGHTQLVSEPEKGVFKYCCLGVACIVTGNTPADTCFIQDWQNENGKIPAVLVEDQSGNVPPLANKLSLFNDGDDGRHMVRRSFKWIATWIEKNL